MDAHVKARGYWICFDGKPEEFHICTRKLQEFHIGLRQGRTNVALMFQWAWCQIKGLTSLRLNVT